MENLNLLARYFVTNVFDPYNLSRKVTTSKACGKRGLDQRKKEERFHKKKTNTSDTASSLLLIRVS